MRKSRLVAAQTLAVILAACETTSSAPPIDADGGPPPALQPSDIPAVAIVADAATQCPGAFATTAPVEGSNLDFVSAGQSRDFFLILPPASFEGPRPLFVALNGTSENGPRFSARANLADFAARGFVVVAPSSNMNGRVWPIWDDMRHADDHDRPNADLAYFDELVQCLAGHFPIDANRIYVGGHSAGGIMTNAIVQRRSEMLAGAIVGSGVFDLTSPPDAMPLDELFVIVTWGGPQDSYSGGVGVRVPEINFVEQASTASQYYASQPGVGHARCSIDRGGGHYWLDPLNDWFVDRLLEHPKGVPGAGGTVPASPVEGVTCTSEPFVYTNDVTVTCEAAPAGSCRETCQFMGDCIVENATVGPVFGPQLEMLGFEGTECGGCVTHCEAMAVRAGDASVMECMLERQSAARCAAGIAGALPLVNAIEGCCNGRTDSGWCMDTCGIIMTNSAAASFFPNCEALIR
jgi:poly(3-hydroxybutyrate) depolymerase